MFADQLVSVIQNSVNITLAGCQGILARADLSLSLSESIVA